MQRPPCARQRTQAETETMRCIACEEAHVTRDAGACKKCSSEANQIVEELKREADELRAKVASLSSCSPTDHRHHLRGCSPGAGLTDVVLVAAEEGPNGGTSMPVPVHRAILASRSPEFKAMLENDTDEGQSSTIKINGMSYDVLRAFVGYLYAEAHLDEQMAFELLVLAEKYQAKPLKDYCEKFLVSKLNLDNSIIYYAFATQHDAEVLLEAAVSLIMDNLDKLRKCQEYSILIEKDPSLVMELYEACLTKKENNAAPKNASVKK